MSPTQTFALRILFPAAIGGLIATLILLIAPEWVLPHVETPAPEAQLQQQATVTAHVQQGPISYSDAVNAAAPRRG